MPALTYRPELVRAFADRFSAGEGFATINEARQLAAAILGEPVHPGTALAKQVDEAVEAGAVRVARRLVQTAETPQHAYAQLVDLYQQQPALTVRSSTSVLQQAYSTPLPIAYLAATLAGIDGEKAVYEPTAGHGVLLLAVNPANATVNELNPERVADLRDQGYDVRDFDALTYIPDRLHDVVIANPPFGSLQDATGATRTFEIQAGADVLRTSQIDQVIALNALKAMKRDGRAVLILGGKLSDDETKRSDRYNSRASRAFYYTLYRHFNVTQHLSIWGDLYRKQGAGFPIDLIQIQGRGQSQRPLPAVAVPRIYKSFDQLGVLLDEFLLQESPRLGSADGATPAGRAGARARERDRQQRALSGAADPARGLADSAVDARARGDPDGNGSVALSNAERVGAEPERTRDNGSRGTRLSPPVAAGMGQSTDSPQRHRTGETLPASHLLSRHRGDRPRHRGVAAGAVSDGGYPTQSGRVAERASSSTQGELDVDSEQTLPKEEPVRQVPYVPSSQGRPVGTLVPVNMQTATANALARLERQVGSLDDYVTDRLGYGRAEDLHQSFSAEQVDACALAIANLERGSGFILGDQTGIGKGRVVAAMIRYAKLTGRTPIFITKDTPLYADMIRDLGDIQMPHFRPFVTNAQLSLPLPDGRQLKTAHKSHRRELAALMDAGQLGDYDAIFTTYSQLQTIKGKETERRQFLRRFAPNAILILDESHEAGGSRSERATPGAAPNRADFVRELIGLAAGAVYSSATYAKRPDVMDLYAKTDMRLAVSNMASLTGMVEQGGVPLQQALATMLTESGQYLRRERSFEGVTFEPAVVPVNREIAENISAIMARVLEFDRLKQEAVRGMDKALKAEAKAVLGDSSTGGAGVTSTNFTSIMHNLIDQMLLALKAEATVQTSLRLLRQPEPEKPVIALSSTMGSFIQQYAELNDLKPGDAIDLGFGDLLTRYLERSRDVLLGNPYGQKSRHHLTDEELGSEAVTEYAAVLDLIDETDLSDIPISPIDFIQFRLGQAGYRVSEVTGREHRLEYSTSGETFYQRRSDGERSKAAAVRYVRDFNSGQADVIILNRSGSTGISLHSSVTFADQRRRHTIVAQPERDINQFMQMLGRVHRTGQVVPPNFTLLMADIPAEKRPGAVLAKKMASLNANTTAARSSGVSLEAVPDFMNEYGNQVVAEIMASDPALHARLDYPLKGAEDDLEPEDAIRKVTGRIPLLPLDEQEQLYDLIEREYSELVQRQEALGESILEARSLDLQARTLARMEVVPADGASDSPFTRPVHLEVIDAKTPRKPVTTLQAINSVRQTLGLAAVEDAADHDGQAVVKQAQRFATKQVEGLQIRVDHYRQQQLPKQSSPAAIDRLNERLDRQFSQVQTCLQALPVGGSVRIVTTAQTVFYGITARVWSHAEPRGSPAALTNWKAQFLLADPVRELTLPLSRINSGKANAVSITAQQQTWEGEDIYAAFDRRQQQNREERQIFTGNLLRAYERFRGKLVNYTDDLGKIRQGLLMARNFDIQSALKAEPVALPAPSLARQFLEETTARSGQLKTLDELLIVKCQQYDSGFRLQTPKARDAGGPYYLDESILAATGSEFYSVGDRMECAVAAERIDAVLETLMQAKGLSLAAFEQQDKARELLGVQLPELEPMAQQAIEVRNPEIPAVPSVDAQTRANLERLLAEDASARQVYESELTPATASASSAEMSNAEAAAPMPIALVQAERPQPASAPNQIALPTAQHGTAEKNVARLLQQGGLSQPLMASQEFHLKIENGPYLPLVVERQLNQLYLTHYQEQNGDLFIDSEMVFRLQVDGRLALRETAVSALGREFRGCDRSFAQLFSRNLLDQGFAEAAQTLTLNGDRPEVVAIAAETTDPEAEQPDLFPAERYATVSPYEVDVNGYDPSWDELDESSLEQTVQEPLQAQSSDPVAVTPVEIAQRLIDQHDPQTGDVLAAADRSPVSPSPTLEQLRNWYRAARDMARDPLRCEYIKTLGLEAKTASVQEKPPAMPTQALVEMQRDLEQYRAYQTRGQYVAQASRLILSAVGQSNGQGEVRFRGKLYELSQTQTALTVKKGVGSQIATILSIACGKMQRTSVQSEDCRKFRAFVQRLQRGNTEPTKPSGLER